MKMLVDLRLRSGLSQRHVAEALGWNQSVVSKIERCQRRMDVVELVRVTKVLGADPVDLVRKIHKINAIHD